MSGHYLNLDIPAAEFDATMREIRDSPGVSIVFEWARPTFIDWSRPVEGASGYSGHPAEYVRTDPAGGRCPHEVRIQFSNYVETWMVDDCGISASMDAMYRGIPLVQNVRAAHLNGYAP